MAEFMKTVFKKVRRIAIIGLTVCVLYNFCSTTIAADFDPIWYAEQNPDVVAELGDSPELLELHYELFGKSECRMANSTDVEAKLRRLFNAEEYAALYPDVTEALGDDPEILFRHYVAYGILESRKASEKMTPATVASLKEALTSALESIGAEAVPGTVAIVTILEGTLTESPEVQNAFVQVQEALVEAVETTIVEANKPEPVVTESSSDSDSSSSSSSDSSSGSSSNDGHTWVQVDSSNHRCSECGIVEEHYGHFDSNHVCVCGWEASTKIHNYDKEHKCYVCGKSADSKEHKFVDTGYGEHKCSICTTYERHNLDYSHKCKDCGYDDPIKDHIYGLDETKCDFCGYLNSNPSGGNTEGGNTEGGNTEGGNTEGGNTEGGNTEGGNTEGGNTEGGNTEGGNTEGGNTEGGNTEGGNTEGGNTEG